MKKAYLAQVSYLTTQTSKRLVVAENPLSFPDSNDIPRYLKKISYFKR
jgi:hypothetical protein